MKRSIFPEAVAEKENYLTLRNNLKPSVLGKAISCCETISEAVTSDESAFKDSLLEKQEGINFKILDNIFNYLKSVTRSENHPSPFYMKKQTDIDATMRAILIDWLIDVTCKFKMRPQVIFMTVRIIDRYLSISIVSQKKLQLVGVAALMIIGKFEEIYPPMLKDYLSVCCNIYSTAEILAMEGEMLIKIGFEVNKPSPYVFLELFKRLQDLEEKTFVFCQYFLEVSLLDIGHLVHAPEQLAAGSIYLVNKLLKRSSWNDSLHMHTGVCETEAKTCAKDIFSILEKVDKSQLKGVMRKYQSSKFFCISKYKIERVSAEGFRKTSHI